MMKLTAGWQIAAGAVLAMVLTAGCRESSSPSRTTTMKVERHIDEGQVARGKALYMQNCARCHGDNGQGDPNWRQRYPDGTFPPPPLDGTGHAWHHSHEWLHGVILRGTEPQGRMPAWQSKLSDQQVDDIIAWFQSQWPDEVYAAWREMELHNRTAN